MRYLKLQIKDPLKVSRLANVWRLESANKNIFITDTRHTCNADEEETIKDRNDFKCALCWLVRGLFGTKDPLKLSRLANA
jgi:hypothetical protein